MGLLRMVLGAVVVWFVWRMLDGMLGGRRRQAGQGPQPKRRKPDDERLGEYVDYEEIED
jgi:hypothetical protein